LKQKKRKKNRSKYNSRGEKLTRHHVLPKKRKGKGTKDNIYYMTNKKHEAFHTLFRHLTFKEAGLLLLKIDNDRTIIDYLGD